MKILRRFSMTLMAAALLMVSACAAGTSNSTVDALNKAQAVGSPFTKALTVEYRNMANEKQNHSLDYSDALHFARKGLASAHGVIVMPEVISDWDIGDKNLAEATKARAQLINALENGGRSMVSDKAAIAQSRFDCWMEQQEQNWGAGAAPCKTGFYTALKELDTSLGHGAAEPGEAPPVENFPEPIIDIAKSGTVPLDQAMFIVFFDWDKTNITSSADDVLDAVAKEIKARRDVKHIHIVGHTDTSGSVKYNDKLSMRRAKAVKDALVARGLADRLIDVEGRGKNDLLVQTPDGVREPANRRGQITLE